MSSAAALIVRCLLLCLLFCTICQGYYLSDYSGSDFTAVRPMKKSNQLRALAGGQNLKNCFFSPINCVITYDASAYTRKLAPMRLYANE